MVCPRCIMAVEAVMRDCGIIPTSVTLGEVTMPEPLAEEQLADVRRHLEGLGFELLNDPKKQLVERICSSIQEWVNMTVQRPKLSTHLQNNLMHEYSTLSKLFTEVRGITIEQYMKLVRIERVKEELCYGEKSIAELSYILGFSSPTHLSAQFKSVIGLSPRQFQQLESNAEKKKRCSLDVI